jgi:hypothetical protein
MTADSLPTQPRLFLAEPSAGRGFFQSKKWAGACPNGRIGLLG